MVESVAPGFSSLVSVETCFCIARYSLLPYVSTGRTDLFLPYFTVDPFILLYLSFYDLIAVLFLLKTKLP